MGPIFMSQGVQEESTVRVTSHYGEDTIVWYFNLIGNIFGDEQKV